MKEDEQLQKAYLEPGKEHFCYAGLIKLIRHKGADTVSRYSKYGRQDEEWTLLGEYHWTGSEFEFAEDPAYAADMYKKGT